MDLEWEFSFSPKICEQMRGELDQKGGVTIWGMACSVLSSSAVDCGVNISLTDPTVLASNT